MLWRNRVGRWWWQARRVREGRRGRGSRVAPSITAKPLSQGLKSDQAASPTQPNPDSHDSEQLPLLFDLTSLALFSTSLRFGRFSLFQFTVPCWRNCTAISPPDFDAIETAAALRGATGKPDIEAACDSP